MTVEVAVMNRSAVALAADSTVTMSGAFGQTNSDASEKLFSLGSNRAVGVMVYGNALFAGVPMETVLKEFQKRLGSRTCGRVEEYAHAFVRFLESDRQLFTSAHERDAVREGAAEVFASIAESIAEAVDEDDRSEFSPEEYNQIVARILAGVARELEALPYAAGASATRVSTFTTRFGSTCKEAVEEMWNATEVGEQIPLTKQKLGIVQYLRRYYLEMC